MMRTCGHSTASPDGSRHGTTREHRRRGCVAPAAQRCTESLRVGRSNMDGSTPRSARLHVDGLAASAPFAPVAVAVAAISGWDEQIEVFVADRLGRVEPVVVVPARLGARRPVQPARCAVRSNAAAEFLVGVAHSAGDGHFNVFVEGLDGQLAVLPHVIGPEGPFWRRCEGREALGDGWWPAFDDSLPHSVYRRTADG